MKKLFIITTLVSGALITSCTDDFNDLPGNTQTSKNTTEESAADTSGETSTSPPVKRSTESGADTSGETATSPPVKRSIESGADTSGETATSPPVK